MKTKRWSRAAGRSWRILAHYTDNTDPVDIYSIDYNLRDEMLMKLNNIDMKTERAKYNLPAPTVLEKPCVFDELVIDQWFHLEQMNNNEYWMAIYKQDGTGVHINVHVVNGRATIVSIDRDEP